MTLHDPAAPLASPVIFTARDVVAGYLPEIDILRGCTLELREGEIVGIIGPNGAGKSTLLRAMFGLIPVRSGAVLLHGENITGRRGHDLVAIGVAYVPQTENVFPRLSVEENLRMGLYLDPARWDERFAIVVELFPLLADRRRQRAGSLSGGERQMLAMGRALMTDPSVVLLDEPSAGLSPVAQGEVFSRIQEINRAGVSIVIVEQNARRCLEISHRAYVLDQGRNAHTGSGRDLLADQKVIELYLGTLARARRREPGS
ncbi:MAG TPA: ABC transporter ATP-binding protein [Acidimicrobiia bacterium]|nr:ABC transporter ATP-binding protein [Acidimicrobiia bacterium]